MVEAPMRVPSIIPATVLMAVGVYRLLEWAEPVCSPAVYRLIGISCLTVVGAIGFLCRWFDDSYK